jgi:serine/threonine-protein kinase
MGWVYEARDRLLNRTVAVKVARAVPGAPPLLQEAQALAAVSHPSVVTVYALGRHRGVQYLVMERIYGVSLETSLQRRRVERDPFSIEEALALLVHVADGLAAVHEAGIAHWDIKPANVMLAPRDRVVLVDFGIFVPEAAAAAAPLFRGTPAYTAPEMVSGTVHPGQAKLVDIYALGILAFEMLAGEHPFRGNTVVEVWNQHLRAPIPDLRSKRPDAPAALSALIAEMMAKDARDRPQYIEDVAGRLRAIGARRASPPEQLSVLIVDDDPAMVLLLEAIVREAQPAADVRTAGDGEAALHAFREKPAHLLLLDLQLPGMSGIDLCLQLRGSGSRSADKCRIVPVSGTAEKHDLRLLLQLGLTTFIDKGADLPQRVMAVVGDTARALARSSTAAR